MFVLSGQGTVGLTGGVLLCVSECEWNCAWTHQYLCIIQFAVLCSIAVVSCMLGLLRGGRGAFLELNSDSYSSCFT